MKSSIATTMSMFIVTSTNTLTGMAISNIHTCRRTLMNTVTCKHALGADHTHDDLHDSMKDHDHDHSDGPHGAHDHTHKD